MNTEDPLRVAGLVLAAGGSRRFGAPKQLATFRGRPLLEYAVSALASAPSLERRFVVLGAGREEVLAGVDLTGVDPVVCKPWSEGQAASLRAGVAEVAGLGASAAVIVLGDQPLIAPEAIERLIAAYRSDPARGAVRAVYGGVPGHPVLISSSLFDAVAELRGDLGARRLLSGADVLEVCCDGLGAPIDIDTVRALRTLESRFRAGRPD